MLSNHKKTGVPNTGFTPARMALLAGTWHDPRRGYAAAICGCPAIWPPNEPDGKPFRHMLPKAAGVPPLHDRVVDELRGRAQNEHSYLSTNPLAPSR